MARQMRRRYQQVEDRATLEGWLAEAVVGRLATVDEDGYPVIKPVNFVYADGKVYFHSATRGEKIDDIRRNPKVGFEVDRVLALIPTPASQCDTHPFYQSIVMRGQARILEGVEDQAEKERVLRLLIAKYSAGPAPTAVKGMERTAVVEIQVEHMTGKEERGQKWSPEEKLAGARALWDRDGDAAAETIALLGLTLEQVIVGASS